MCFKYDVFLVMSINLLTWNPITLIIQTQVGRYNLQVQNIVSSNSTDNFGDVVFYFLF